MTVNIIFFAAAKELTGHDQMQLDLDDGSTVADVQRELATLFPDLANLMKSAMWSVDRQYAGIHDVLPNGAEVGLILPVSGG